MKATPITNSAIAAALALVCSLGVTGILPGAAAAQPFQISADGTEVTDQGSGLVWRRCVEGMVWDGTTCAGTPGDYSHSQAPQQAATQAAATGQGWRLPNTSELATLADLFPPKTTDSTIFPANPKGWFWSVSPNVGYLNYEMYLDFAKEYYDLGYAWYVGYLNDSVYGYNRGLTKHVRLVRNGQ